MSHFTKLRAKRAKLFEFSRQKSTSESTKAIYVIYCFRINLINFGAKIQNTITFELQMRLFWLFLNTVYLSSVAKTHPVTTRILYGNQETQKFYVRNRNFFLAYQP